MTNPVYFTNVRLSFPHIKEPHSANPQQAPAKYSADFLINPNSPELANFMQEVMNAAAEKWGADAQNVINMINSDKKMRCYGDGSEKVNKKTFQPYDGYAGHTYISANRNDQPQLIKPDGNAANPSNSMECMDVARSLYGGCYVNVALKPWLQDNSHGRAIRCEIIAIQFAADGEAFGEGVTDASGMFGAAGTPQAAQPATPVTAPQQQIVPPTPPAMPGSVQAPPEVPSFLK